MILIGYDGSPDARVAIARAGGLFGGQRATVLCVWRPFIAAYTQTAWGWGVSPLPVAVDEIDEKSELGARARAREGAVLAREAGLDADALVVSAPMSVADSITAEADALDADAIVVGSRGLGGIKSLMLGSVSHAVLQHAARPVVVVPSPEVAQARTAVD
jgi:nucleotide-binding universal stress UspA family protein